MTAARGADRRELWGSLISIVSSAAAGASLVAVRFAVAEMPPLTLTLMRIAIALALIAPLALALGGRWPRGRELVQIMALGILVFALAQWLVSLSLVFTTVARGAIIFSTVPVMTLVAAAALGVERLTLAKGAGVLLATAGVVLAMGGGASGEPNAWRGDLIMLAAAVAIAAYNIGARGPSRRYAPLVFITANMAPAVLVLAVATAASGLPVLALDLSTPVWTAVAFVGIVGGAIAHGLYLFSIRLTTPTRVAIAMPANPLAAILLAAAILGEPIGAGAMAGFVCVAVGVVLANLPARPTG